MNITLCFLFVILILVLIFIPSKKNIKKERFKVQNKTISIKNTLKYIPKIIPHLII